MVLSLVEFIAAAADVAEVEALVEQGYGLFFGPLAGSFFADEELDSMG